MVLRPTRRVQPPRIPSPTHDVENAPSTQSLHEGRRKKKKKRDRSRSRSREPANLKAKQTVDAALARTLLAGARPAYYDQLTSIEHVRDSLPISFSN